MKVKTAALCLFSLLLLSCAREIEQMVPDNYRHWTRTTETALDYPIPGHENSYRRIYINPKGLKYTVEEDKRKTRYLFPEGTVIVKEVYDGLNFEEGDSPSQLTAMVKDSQDPRNRGGWLWLLEDPSTKEERVMEGQFCITCHSNANERHPYGDNNVEQEFRDYVFFLPIR